MPAESCLCKVALLLFLKLFGGLANVLPVRFSALRKKRNDPLIIPGWTLALSPTLALTPTSRQMFDRTVVANNSQGAAVRAPLVTSLTLSVVVTDSQGAAVCAPLLLPDRPLLLASLGWGVQGPSAPHDTSPFAQLPAASPSAAAASSGATFGSSSSSSNAASSSHSLGGVLSNGDAGAVKSDGVSSTDLGAGGAGGGAMYVVGMVDAGVCVMDRQSGRRLQFIPFAHDDAWIQSQISCHGFSPACSLFHRQTGCISNELLHSFEQGGECQTGWIVEQLVASLLSRGSARADMICMCWRMCCAAHAVRGRLGLGVFAAGHLLHPLVAAACANGST
eukprot:scaffold105244_cov15-Tisochrysis_lutea.AAC.1